MNLDLVHGYSFYYATLGATITDPAPITYHRVVSPNGAYWKHVGSDTSSSIGKNTPTNDLSALIHTLTNGAWSVTLNIGDPSEATYDFHVEIRDVTTNLFGDILVTAPAANSVVTNNPPTFEWRCTSMLPEVNVSAYDVNHDVSVGASLSSTATNWTPFKALAEGENRFYPRYSSNDFAGVTFSAPTNRAGGSIMTNFFATADVRAYAIHNYSITNAPPPPPPPPTYEADFQLSIVGGASSDSYGAYPIILNGAPFNPRNLEVESPNALCQGTEVLSASSPFATLSALIDECEAGDWKLYFNRDTPSNQLYHFTLDLGGLDTNLLERVQISSPLNGATNLIGNPAYAWTGPAGFSTLRVLSNQADISLTPSDTTWPDAPVLAPGANGFRVQYQLNTYSAATISSPTNHLGEALDHWSANARLRSEAAVQFTVATGSGPVARLQPRTGGGAFALDYTSFDEPDDLLVLQSRTNLTEGAWDPVFTFIGTGAPLRFEPVATNSAAYYRVIRAAPPL